MTTFGPNKTKEDRSEEIEGRRDGSVTLDGTISHLQNSLQGLELVEVDQTERSTRRIGASGRASQEKSKPSKGARRRREGTGKGKGNLTRSAQEEKEEEQGYDEDGHDQRSSLKQYLEPSGKESSGNQGTTISSLSPKPCRTCGRMITPRAKWSKNWEEIKFCSDGCRNQRPDKARVDWTLQGEASISRFEAWCSRVDERESRGDGSVNVLRHCLILSVSDPQRRKQQEQQLLDDEVDNRKRETLAVGEGSYPSQVESEGTIKLSVELERWTEVCLLYVAVNGPASFSSIDPVVVRGVDPFAAYTMRRKEKNNSIKSDNNILGNKRGYQGDRLATCEDVEAKLKFDLEELLTSVAEFQDAEGDREGKGSGQVRELSPAKVREHPFKDNPLWKGLDATPGLRERVRRAARRIKVFGECESQATLGTREPPFEMGRVKLELVQKGRRLETLQDLSLAKGPIELRAVSR